MFENILRNIFKNKNNYYNLIFIIFLGILLFFLSNNNFNNNNSNSLLGDELPQNNSNSLLEVEANLFDLSSYDSSYEEKLEQRLEYTLSQVEGVGNVNVMISTNNSKELITKSDTVQENAITSEEALTGDNRNIKSDKYQDTTVKINGDEPLILKEISPTIEGVLIVAQGGDNIQIKNSLINATNALLGVEVHKIQVLKMK